MGLPDMQEWVRLLVHVARCHSGVMHRKTMLFSEQLPNIFSDEIRHCLRFVLKYRAKGRTEQTGVTVRAEGPMGSLCFFLGF